MTIFCIKARIKFRPVAAYYAPQTINNSNMQNNLMLRNSNFGLTLGAYHTNLLKVQIYTDFRNYN